MTTKDGTIARHEAQGADREIQRLWFALTRREWSSVTIVPADGATPFGSFAKSLADVGRLLEGPRLAAIVATELDYPQAAAITGVVMSARGGRHAASAMDARNLEIDVQTAGSPAFNAALTRAPERVVVEIPAVIEQPLGVAVARASDIVVIVIEFGRTKLEDVRRTVDLVGEERIAGCVMLR